MKKCGATERAYNMFSKIKIYIHVVNAQSNEGNIFPISEVILRENLDNITKLSLEQSVDFLKPKCSFSCLLLYYSTILKKF